MLSRVMVFTLGVFLCTVPCLGSEPLASWRDAGARQSITAFVDAVTREQTPDFVPQAERVAVFDNDGTLWSEQPMYFQLFFALDRVKAMASEHPEWKEKEPFKSVLAGDLKTALAGGEKAILELVAATHAGMTTEEFEQQVKDWIAKAKHPVTGRPFTEMVYLPMLELLAYLRANGFKTYIVSGGGIEFMRPWCEAVYGIPPENVIGSSSKTTLEFRGDKPVLMKQPEINSLDDKAEKPVNINLHIGRRPIAAFGNSDGDLAMLQWTAAGGGADAGRRLCVIIHHDDADREWAYDRKSPIGKLDKALDEAQRRAWTVVSMKSDWKAIFPWSEREP